MFIIILSLWSYESKSIWVRLFHEFTNFVASAPFPFSHFFLPSFRMYHRTGSFCYPINRQTRSDSIPLDSKPQNIGFYQSSPIGGTFPRHYGVGSKSTVV